VEAVVTFASITIGLDPVLFHLGPIAIRWYGLGYVVGIIVGLWVAAPYARERGLTEEQIWRLVPWAIVAGLIGGRLYYVVQNDFGYYLRHPQHILAFWEGGMAFYGAIFAVVAVIAWFAWREHYPLWKFLDAGALFAVLGQAFGRIGNIINGDIVGYPTSLPWGTVYTNPHSLAPELGVAYQPAAAYELLFNLCFFAVLWGLRRRLAPGWLFVIYIFGYCVGQFGIFFLRANSVLWLGLKQAQWTAIVVFVLTIPVALWLYRHPAQVTRQETATPAPAG
jgi:phosphatidylglycerol:prolipoprotein diacylglycerol transferase